MKTLIIYDNIGRIWYQASGNVQEPVGLQYKWFNLESGKFAVRIDVSDINNPIPIYDNNADDVVDNKSTVDSGDSVDNTENNENSGNAVNE